MKHNNLLLKCYSGLLLTVFGVIVFHAPLSVYVGTLFPDADLLIKSWKEILLGIALPMGVYLAIKNGLAAKMKKDWLFLAIASFALLHIVLLAVFSASLEQSLAGLAIDLRFILFFTLVYIAVSLAPQCRRHFLIVGVIGAALSIGFSLLQIFVLPVDILSYIGYGKDTITPYLTIDKNTDFIRINGTLRGPNPLGAYMVIVIATIAAWVVAKKHTIKERSTIILLSVLALLSLIVLWSSYSRSALAAAFISLGVIAITLFGKKIRPQWWAGLAVLVLIFSGVLYAQRDSHFIQQVVLHNNPSGGSARDSDDERAASIQTGLERLLVQPIGAGIGSTGSASLLSEKPLIIENHYLFIAHESGWIGLALFLYIFATILWRLWNKRADWLALAVLASGIGLACIGLTLPVWADDTVSIIWWGLAGIALATQGSHAKRKQQTK